MKSTGPKNPAKSALSRTEMLSTKLREMSGWTVAFHHSIATRLGLNGTDHKCLDLLMRDGPMTAGEMARRSGYTTGAITGVIDRLSAAGLAQRVADPHDRRRVMIEPHAERAQALIGPLFAGMRAATRAVLAEFSADELLVLERFIDGCTAAVRQQVLGGVPGSDELNRRGPRPQ